MKNNNKGFTLIELLATIVLFAIVAGFGTYAISDVIRSSREKNYKLLIHNIKDAAELYYQECRYDKKAKNSGNYDGIICQTYGNGYVIPLQGLVEQGYLTGNAKENGEYTIVNPSVNNTNIALCCIYVEYNASTNKSIVQPLINPSMGCFDIPACPKNSDFGE